MKTETNATHLVTTSLDRLSKAADKILSRFPSGSSPTKLTLLNDIAAAMRPGVELGALKAARLPVANVELRHDPVIAIPSPPPGARVLPARLYPIRAASEQLSLGDLLEDVRPLFTLTHNGLPIVGLEIEAFDGNGDFEILPWPNLLVLNDARVEHCRSHVLEMSAEVARFAFGAVQNLAAASLYSVLGQLDTGSLHIVLGPCDVVAAIPSALGRSASLEVPTQGVRVLVDEDKPSVARDLEIMLALAGAAMPYLKLRGLDPLDGAVRLTLSVPHLVTWKPVDLELPEVHGDYDKFWRNGEGSWSPGAPEDFPFGKLYKLDEALDLALAVINIDDPNLFLHASVSPPPETKRRSMPKEGWRGRLSVGWRILRLPPGARAEALDLAPEESRRIERALNGWAVREGFQLVEKDERAVKFVIMRAQRRASHHLEEVRILAEAAGS